jgi:predicted sulfurtransferase
MNRQVRVRISQRAANCLHNGYYYCCELKLEKYHQIKEHIQKHHLPEIEAAILKDDEKAQFMKRRLSKGKSDSIRIDCNCSEGIILLFYNYVEILNQVELARVLQDFCVVRDICGKIRIGKEGFNITVGGSAWAIEEFMQYFLEREALLPGVSQLQMEHIGLFKKLYFKPSLGCQHCFDGLSVKIVSEICPLGVEAPTPSPYSLEVAHELLGKQSSISQVRSLTPQQFHEEVAKAKHDPDTIVLDTRNYYETMFGYFDQAIRPPIRKFSAFPEYVKQHKQEWQNKKIITYCTGGIRCEKASRFIQEETGSEVMMLRGGIHNYLEEIEDGLYRGVNYVFDARRVEGTSNDTLVNCLKCGAGCLEFTKCSNCHLVLPNCCRLEFCCSNCQSGKKCNCSSLLKSLVVQ